MRVLANLRRIIQAVYAESIAIESATGLSGPQFWALQELAGQGDGLSLGELASRLALHKANAGRLVERLANKKLVERTKPAHDRRVVLVRATKAGQRLARSLVAGPPQALLLARLGRLPNKQLLEIEATLARLVVLVGAKGTKPEPLFDPDSSSSR